MRLTTIVPVVTVALLALGNDRTAPLTAQASATRLHLTTASEEARGEFRSALKFWEHAHLARAVPHLERALSLDPEFGLARILRGQFKPGLTPAERQEEFSRGLNSLAKATAPEALIGLGWREQFSGRQPVGRAALESAHQQLPNDPDVARWYYSLRAFGGTTTQTLANWREAIAKHPTVPVFHRALAYVLFFEGDRAGGISGMQEYARLDPTYANTHESLADLLLRDGREAEATAAARRAIAADPTFGSSYAILAYIRHRAGDGVGALTHWSDALRNVVNPVDSADFTHALAMAHLRNGDWGSAMTRLGEAATKAEGLRLTAPAALMHQRMAVIDALYGGGQGLNGHLTKAEQLGGANTANQHLYASLAHAAARHPAPARAAAERFRAVATPATQGARHVLNGFIALQSGDPAAALAELGQASPADLLGQALKADALAQRGQTAEAHALRRQVTQSLMMPPLTGAGSIVRIPDFFVVLAQLRAQAN